jgi:hypothetical protein
VYDLYRLEGTIVSVPEVVGTVDQHHVVISFLNSFNFADGIRTTSVGIGANAQDAELDACWQVLSLLLVLGPWQVKLSPNHWKNGMGTMWCIRTYAMSLHMSLQSLVAKGNGLNIKIPFPPAPPPPPPPPHGKRGGSSSCISSSSGGVFELGGRLPMPKPVGLPTNVPVLLQATCRQGGSEQPKPTPTLMIGDGSYPGHPNQVHCHRLTLNEAPFSHPSHENGTHHHHHYHYHHRYSDSDHTGCLPQTWEQNLQPLQPVVFGSCPHLVHPPGLAPLPPQPPELNATNPATSEESTEYAATGASRPLMTVLTDLATDERPTASTAVQEAGSTTEQSLEVFTAGAIEGSTMVLGTQHEESTNIAVAAGSLEATGTIEESTLLATTGESHRLTTVTGAIDQSTEAGGVREPLTGELRSTIALSGGSEGLATIQEATRACDQPADVECHGFVVLSHHRHAVKPPTYAWPWRLQ